MAGAGSSATHDLTALLSGNCRDFLVRNNGDQVKVRDLESKTVGIYFSRHSHGPCRAFTTILADDYAELFPRGLEVVFISADEREASFDEYFSEMPWLAVPFSDWATRGRVMEQFKLRVIPSLVVLDGITGRFLTDNAVDVIRNHGAEGYPFTPTHLSKLQEAETAAKRNQTLHNLLASRCRDFVINSNGDKVPISDLVGKIVCLYFSVASHLPCLQFTPLLTKMYQVLKERGEPFEVALVSLGTDEVAFEDDFMGMPWLAMPYMDRNVQKLCQYFDLTDLPGSLPILVVIGADEKTLCANAAEIVARHGAGAYPFEAEKLAELAMVERASGEAQTMGSLLVCDGLDFVIAKDGVKVPVSELVGKYVVLYFGLDCPPCREFTPKLIQVYHEIKAKHSDFEVIYISADQDRRVFDEYFSTMPWLALLFEDVRTVTLTDKFKITTAASLVAIDPSGRTVTTEARYMVEEHAADAYPFTEERVEQLYQEMAKGWPEKVKHPLHEEHELKLARLRVYGCDGCKENGRGWSFCCRECNFDLHPACALKVEEKEAAEDEPAE